MGRRFYQPPNWLTTLLVVIFLFQEVTEMYDVLIVGAGPGGIFTAYELLEKRPDLRIAVFEMGNELKKRHCPIDGDKIKSCIHCKNCSIMSGFGGAGATVPLTGFGFRLAEGVMKEVEHAGILGIFTGGIKSAAAGITAAIFFAFFAALFANPKEK